MNKIIFGIIKRITNRPPDVVVDKDYMDRWYIIPRNKIMNIYFHRFYGSDAPIPHDHPWWSLSWILQGSYREFTPEKGMCIKREGSITLRNAKQLHYIEINEPAYTLFITGPRIRDWGFQCESGWVHFREYIKRRGSSRLANGCGEE